MFNRLELSIRPNNQITLTYGNYRHVKEFYKDIPTIEAGYGKPEKIRLQRAIDRAKMRNEPKYNWRGELIVKKRKLVALPLVIIKKSQRTPKKCKLNKPKNFSARAGQKLRECGAAIDHICGNPDRTVAITLTLPAHHVGAFTALAAYSGYAINRLFQPIRRKYGDDVLWFFVWEYQKRGALHLHCALYHPEKDKALEIGRTFREQWHKILADIGEMADTNMFLGRNGKDNSSIEKMHFYCEPMKRGLGAYFSKYAGKQESKQNWYCQKYPVSRFWGCNYALKALIKKLSFNFTLEIDDNQHIEFLVNEIISRLAKKDINLQSEYDFDIKKTYDSGYSLGLAKGKRQVFYCSPIEFGGILGMFADLHSFF